jgi:hypothetical protein
LSNTSYITGRRQGTRAGVAPGSVRICVTLSEQAFKALRARAEAAHHTLSGEAALIVSDAVAPAEREQAA